VLTLKITGGTKMLKEALSVVQGSKIKLIGLTVRTSMSNEHLSELGRAREAKPRVILLASLAKKGLDCSSLSMEMSFVLCSTLTRQ
jgi:orotidine-5'-phosphate decarboxylase